MQRAARIAVANMRSVNDAARNLAAFVLNGAILPRASGASDLPMKAGAVPFQSPPGLEVEIELPHGFTARGMGVYVCVCVCVVWGV